jgi:hypothetical protein
MLMLRFAALVSVRFLTGSKARLRFDHVTAFVSFTQTLARIIRPHRLVAVAVFALGALSANEASATCGDWLAHDEPSPGAMVGSDHPSLPDMPCDGPNCRSSRHDSPVVPAGPSRQLERPERWYWLDEDLAAQPALSSLLPAEADLRTIEGFRPSIERPPRT